MGDMGDRVDSGKRGCSHQIVAVSAGSREDATARQLRPCHGGWTGAYRQSRVHSSQFTVKKQC